MPDLTGMVRTTRDSNVLCIKLSDGIFVWINPLNCRFEFTEEDELKVCMIYTDNARYSLKVKKDGFLYSETREQYDKIVRWLNDNEVVA